MAVEPVTLIPYSMTHSKSRRAEEFLSQLDLVFVKVSRIGKWVLSSKSDHS